MSQNEIIAAGYTGLRYFAAISRANFSPILGGNVYYVLKAITGPNAGLWYSTEDGTWNEGESGTLMLDQESDGAYSINPTFEGVSPFAAGVQYIEYVKSEGIGIPDHRFLTAVENAGLSFSPGNNFDDYLVRGSASNIHRVYFSDATTGKPLSGLTYDGDSFSIAVQNGGTAIDYELEDGLIQTIATPGTYTAPASGKCRFGEVGDGWYEVQFENNLYVSSEEHLEVTFTGSGGSIDYANVPSLRIFLAEGDSYSLLSKFVRVGLVALPPESSTSFSISTVEPFFGDFGGTIDGCQIIIYSEDESHACYRTIRSSADAEGNCLIVIDRATPFDIVEGSPVLILPPGFSKTDVDVLAARSSQTSVSAIATALVALAASLDSLSVVATPEFLAAMADSVAAQDDIAATREIVATNLNARVGDIPGSGFAPGTPIDPSRESIPVDRTFVFVNTQNGFESEDLVIITVSDVPVSYAVDYRGTTSSNQTLYSVDSVDFTQGDSNGLFVSAIEDWKTNSGTQGRFQLRGITAGEYRVRLQATLLNPGTAAPPAFLRIRVRNAS